MVQSKGMPTLSISGSVKVHWKVSLKMGGTDFQASQCIPMYSI